MKSLIQNFARSALNARKLGYKLTCFLGCNLGVHLQESIRYIRNESVNNIWIKTEVIFFTGDHFSALKRIRNALGSDILENGCTSLLTAKNMQAPLLANSAHDKKCVEICCYLLLSNGLHETALNYLEWLDKNSATVEESLKWKILSADSLNTIFCYKQSLQVLEEVFKILSHKISGKTSFPLNNNLDNFFKSMSPNDDAGKQMLETASHAYKALATTCRHLKFFDQSEAFVRCSLKMIEPMHLSTEDNYDIELFYCETMAAVQFEQEDFEEALQHQQLCLQKLRHRYGESSSSLDLSRCYRNMAKILCNLWNYEESLKCCQLSQDILKKLYNGETHSSLEFAQSLEEEGLIYLHKEQFDISLQVLTKAKITRSIALRKSPSDPRIAHSLHLLGRVYQKLKQWDKAMEYFEDAYFLLEETDTPHKVLLLLAEILRSAAQVNSEIGNFTLAFEQSFKSLELVKLMHNDTRDIIKAISSEAVGKLPEKFEIEVDGLNLFRFAAGEQTSQPTVAIGYSSVGDVHLENGNFSEAVRYYEKALQIMEKIFGKYGNRQTATISEKIGIAYLKQKKFKAARQCFESCLKILKPIYKKRTGHRDLALIHLKISYTLMEDGSDELVLKHLNKSLDMLNHFYKNSDSNVDSASVYSQFGAFYFKRAEYQKSLENSISALKALKACCGDDANNLEIATANNNVGKAYIKLGDSIEALKHCKQSLTTFKEIYQEGSHSLQLAAAYRDCGEAHKINGNHECALKNYKYSLGLLKNFPDHKDTGETYRQIGDLEFAIRKFDDALESYSKESEILKKLKDKNRTELATNQTNIGNVHQLLANFNKALKHYEDCLRILKKLHGEDADHRDIAICYRDMTRACNDMGRTKDAEKYCTLSHKMIERVHGKHTNHVDIGRSHQVIAELYCTKGNFPSVIKEYEKALKIFKRTYGENANHRDIANCYRSLADIHNVLKEQGKAIEYLNLALEMQKKLHGLDTYHPDIAAIHQKLAETYESQTNYKEALNSHIHCLGILKAVYKMQPNHDNIATSYTNIGNIFSKQGKQDQALKYFQKSLEMMKAVYGNDANHPHIALVYRNIGITYKVINKHGEAKDNLTSALQMFQAIYDSDHPHIVKTREMLDDLQTTSGTQG